MNKKKIEVQHEMYRVQLRVWLCLFMFSVKLTIIFFLLSILNRDFQYFIFSVCLIKSGKIFMTWFTNLLNLVTFIFFDSLWYPQQVNFQLFLLFFRGRLIVENLILLIFKVIDLTSSFFVSDFRALKFSSRKLNFSFSVLS